VSGLAGSERQATQQERHHAEGDDLPEQHSTSSFDAQVLSPPPAARFESRLAHDPAASHHERARAKPRAAQWIVRTDEDRGTALDDVAQQFVEERAALVIQ